MTVVATDGIVIAADSAITYGRITTKDRQHCLPKVWAQNGSIFAYAGTVHAQQQFKTWLDQHSSIGPGDVFTSYLNGDREDYFEAMEIDSNGVNWRYVDGVERCPLNPPDAMGSGASCAWAALDAGFDPRYAVLRAIQLNGYCSNPIVWLQRPGTPKETFVQSQLKCNGQWYKMSTLTQRIIDISPTKFRCPVE